MFNNYISSSSDGSKSNSSSSAGDNFSNEELNEKSNHSPHDEDANSDENIDDTSQDENVSTDNSLLSNLKSQIECSNEARVKHLLDLIDHETLDQEVSGSDEETTGTTLLHVAAKKGNIKIFDLILANWESTVDTADSEHHTILSHCIREENKDLYQHLHIKLTSSILSHLYEALDNIADSPAAIVNNIMGFNDETLLHALFEYNYDLALEAASSEDEHWSDELESFDRAKLYFHLSQWNESTGNNAAALELIEKAQDIVDNENLEDVKLYRAYKASLLLGKSEYVNAYQNANQAAQIPNSCKLAEFYIFYVKTIYYLSQKNKNKYTEYYKKLMQSYNQLEPKYQDSKLIRKLKHCFGDLSDQDERRQVVNAAATPLTSLQAGMVSKFFGKNNLEYRPPRKFHNNRLEQLMKHLSSQLFFAAETKDIKLVEVEILYLELNGKHKIFIASNKMADAEKFFNLLKNKDNAFLRTLLTTEYKDVHFTESKNRSKRYAHKLKQLIVDNNEFIKKSTSDFNTMAANKLIQILKTAKPAELKIEYKKKDNAVSVNNTQAIKDSLVSDVSIYLITGKYPGFPERHAEEFLCDILDIARTLIKSGFNSWIGGKMRPCIACSGRMEESQVQHYSKNSGKVWLKTILFQNSHVAAKSLDILFDKPTCITVDKNGNQIPSYDSGSEDSEEHSKSILRKCTP